MSDPSNPRRPKPPAPPPGRPVPPPHKAPGAAGSLPSGKAVPPAKTTAQVRAVTPPPVGSIAQPVGGGSSGGFRAIRRRGTPAGAWIGIAFGVLVVTFLAYFLYEQQRKKTTERERDTAAGTVATPAEEASSAAKPAPEDPKSVAKAKPAPGTAEPEPRKAKKPSEPARKKSSKDKSRETKPSEKADAVGPKAPKADESKDAGRVAIRSSSFGAAVDAPADESPAELTKSIEDGLNLLDEEQFDAFVAKHVFPAKPSDAVDESEEDEPQPADSAAAKPTGKEIAGLSQDRLRLALKHILANGEKPHFPLDDRSVAIFVLSGKTQLHFIKVDGQWRLHRNRAVRFRRHSPQERLIAELARLTAKEALKPTEEVVGEARMSVISQLQGMNAIVAVTAAGDDEHTAVLFGADYRGGVEGIKLFDQLANVAILICESPPGFDDNMLAELDEMTTLRHLKLAGVTSPLPLTLHLRDMKRLESLALDGGLMEDIHMDHLEKLTALRRLVISARGLSDAALDRLQTLSELRQLTLDIRPAGSISSEAVARLRRAMPKLWVDW
jgi:hypothetical protein